MRTRNMFTGVVTVGLLASIPAFAGGGVLDACKAELKQFACNATTEEQAHQCLERHEQHAKKDDGFSHACYEAHEAYEKRMRKMEKGEQH
ncbi:MAG TPA: hypothetical protein VL137_17905 [Polyangiaceae bacterium]|nr:hypothetical protein [Polyangiaceae bacterium]